MQRQHFQGFGSISLVGWVTTTVLVILKRDEVANLDHHEWMTHSTSRSKRGTQGPVTMENMPMIHARCHRGWESEYLLQLFLSV